jgi:5'-3' exonuclease
MFMMPLKCVELLPKPIQNVMLDPNNILRKPIDYFPKDFQLDKF